MIQEVLRKYLAEQHYCKAGDSGKKTPQGLSFHEKCGKGEKMNMTHHERAYRPVQRSSTCKGDSAQYSQFDTLLTNLPFPP